MLAPEHAHYMLLIIALVLVTIGLGGLLKYSEQNNWIEKKAKIVSIEEIEEEVAESLYAKTRYYYPKAEYEYSVNGIAHKSSTVCFEKENLWVPEVNTWGDPTPREKRWWLNLNAGDLIPVYINPKKETEAVLIKHPSKHRRSHHAALVIGGILIGAIWLFLVIPT